MELDNRVFRTVLGHFASGVVIVTSSHDGEPVGLTAQSFSALSLDPPLVLFCPAKSSTTWPKVRATNKFCINVLGEHQQDLCQQFAVSGGNKFEGVQWVSSENELPLLTGCLAYVECTLHDVYEAGDHEIAIGLVEDLRKGESNSPLLFYQGTYRQLLHVD